MAPTQTPSPIDNGDPSRTFSTPDGLQVSVPAGYALSEDDLFSYKVGHLEGRSGKDFAKVFDKSVYDREPFFDGFSDGVALLKAEKEAKVPTPDLREVRL